MAEITEDQIRCAWDATKQGHQPVYDELPHSTRALLRRRADLVTEFGPSDDEWWSNFEKKLLEPEVVEPLPLEVVEELVAEAVAEPPPPEPEPVPLPVVEETPPPEPPKKKAPAKKTAKKLAETKEEKKAVRKPVLVKKATTKATKKAVKK